MTSNILRVGFFGSDHFSINCLKKLLPLRSPSGPISHLDIITRNPKPSGRGLKQLKDVPISGFALSNNLNLLRADSKQDFKKLLSQNYNICIAVSYGRLIPSDFLSQLQFGGLNVHPSLLPKYSGPAPLHRALLNQDQYTGVTVQTLHPTEFDKGEILLQTSYEIRRNETLNSLAEALSSIGGDQLSEVLTKAIYDPSSPTHQILHPDEEYSYGKKIQTIERQVNWRTMSSFDLFRNYKTLGPLYTFKYSVPSKKQKKKQNVDLVEKRVVLDGIDEYRDDPFPNDAPPGTFSTSPEDGKLIIKTLDGTITADSVKVEGLGAEDGLKFVQGLKKKFGTTDLSFKID